MSSSNTPVLLTAGVLLLGAPFARAAVDLSAIVVTPQRAQPADQARRDRYECHHWAVDQTGVVPLAAGPEADRTDEDRARRRDRLDRALNGAAIGAGVGGLIRAARDRNPGQGVLAGAAAGAAVGAATAGRDARAADGPTDGEAHYLRALSACLEGRGYSVVLPVAPASDERTAVAKWGAPAPSRSRSAASIAG